MLIVIMLIVILLSVIMLSVVMLNVVMLNVVAPKYWTSLKHLSGTLSVTPFFTNKY